MATLDPQAQALLEAMSASGGRRHRDARDGGPVAAVG
jgi:hypothetical protein